MSYGPIMVFTSTMASGATLSNEVDLKYSFETVLLEIPSMVSNTQYHIQVASESGGTYRRMMQTTINTSAAQIHTFVIASAVTGRFVPLVGAATGMRFVKVETTATVDDGCVFKFICGY